MTTRSHSLCSFGFPAIQRWLAIGCALLLIRLAGAEPAADTFRVGFSHALFTDVNEDDAKAAVKAWGQTIAKDNGVSTAPEPIIFKNTLELVEKLRSRQADLAGMSVIEYAEVSRQLNLSPIFITDNAGQTREQYLLLVHQDGGFQSAADLRGRGVAFHQNIRSCLAQPWLDVLLLQAGAKPAAEWAGKIIRSPKLSQVVLPVFFRQNDACVVTRVEFETLNELNPQIGRQLKVIASSPELVTAIFCLRGDYAPSFREKLLTGLRNLHKTPAGQQVLTIFQSQKLEEQPASCLAGTLEFMAQHAQLISSAAVSNALPQSAALPALQGVKP